MSGLRQRRKPVAQVVTEFDAFPKIPETYVEQTTTGGSGRFQISDFKSQKLYCIDLTTSWQYQYKAQAKICCRLLPVHYTLYRRLTSHHNYKIIERTESTTTL